MKVYYNEFHAPTAVWLRELGNRDLVPGGVVDERDIRTLTADDVKDYGQVHLFAGIGGWAYALKLAGWPDDWPVWTGSCPCQPFSSAGKRAGTQDDRHLWPEMLRLIAECRPAIVFGEQVASCLGRDWLAGVRADLEALGYEVGTADLCAAGVGAPHIRQRLYWVAYSECGRKEVYSQAWFAAHDDETSSRHGTTGQGSCWTNSSYWDMPDARRRCERGSLPLANGVSERMDDIRGYGNAIVPQVAATFIRAAVQSIAAMPQDRTATAAAGD